LRVPDSVLAVWGRYFRGLCGAAARDYAIGFAENGRKRLRRVAYADLDHFLELAQRDWKRYGQYLSIHDFGSKLRLEVGVMTGINYHTRSEKSVKPDRLCAVYIDIEPKRDGVGKRETAETLARLITSVRDALGAEPVAMQTRPGRYGVVYLLRGVDLGGRSYAFAQLLYRELWHGLLRIAGLAGMVNVTVDPQVKDLMRVTRVPYTFHELTRRMVAPIELAGGRPRFVKARDFDPLGREPVPDDFVSEAARRVEEELRRREEEARAMRERLLMRRLEEVIRDGLSGLDSALSPMRRRARWRTVEAPDLGRVRYHPRLEGWGWVRTLVRERIPLPDARVTFAWLTLPWAVKRGLVTEEEARLYLEHAARAAPGKDPEEYVGKLEDNMRYSYTAPAWRSLVTGTRKDGSPLSDYNEHIRAAVLAALMWAGLVEVERPDRLSDLLGFDVTEGLPRARRHER